MAKPNKALKFVSFASLTTRDGATAAPISSTLKTMKHHACPKSEITALSNSASYLLLLLAFISAGINIVHDVVPNPVSFAVTFLVASITTNNIRQTYTSMLFQHIQ